MSKNILLPLCALLLLAGSARAAGVTFISSCPFTITQPGQYHLAQDLTCGGFAVIIINSNDVEVHFDGHTLTGVGALIGIEALNVSNISIFGSGTITGFRNGISFQGVTGGSIVNMTTNNNGIGIILRGSSSINLISNISSFNGFLGINDFAGSNNIFRANQTDSNGVGINGIGIAIGASTGDLIEANKAHNNGRFGFDLDDTDPSCGSNTWKSNQFGTANQSCIQ